MSGAGVNAARRALLTDVFGRATEPEQQLLWRVLSGELRQGALDGVMVDAVAKAAGVPIAAVRRAHMLAGDLGVTARAALTGGRRRARRPSAWCPGGRCSRCWRRRPPTSPRRSTRPGRRRSSGSSTGRGSRPTAATASVRIFTRNLNEITDRLGAVAALVAGLPGGDLVLDGEALGVDDEGAPRRFQDTMGDFGADAPTGRGHGLSAYFFDVLHAGGAPVVDEPLSVRRELLATIVPAVGTAAVDRHGRRRRGGGVPRPGGRRRPRGRDGQGARLAVRRRAAGRGVAQDQAGPHARPRRARRRVGPRPAHRAGCPTCTSAPAATTARS